MFRPDLKSISQLRKERRKDNLDACRSSRHPCLEISWDVFSMDQARQLTEGEPRVHLVCLSFHYLPQGPWNFGFREVLGNGCP